MATSQQSKLIVYLIMILGLILGYLYSSASDPTSAVPPLDSRFQLTSMQALKSARIDAGFLSDTTLSSLRVFGSLPVEPDAGGKSNPFQ